MQKKHVAIAACLLVINMFSAQSQDLQTVTGNGHTTTNPIVINGSGLQFTIQGNSAAYTGADMVIRRSSSSPYVGMGAASQFEDQTPGSENLNIIQSSLGGGLQFFNHYIGASWIESMRIAPNGNVGIGTASTVSKLTVAGNISLDRSRYIFFGGDLTSTGEYIYEAPEGTINVHAGFNNAIVVPNNNNLYLAPVAGSVGIGTTSPGNYKLAIEGIIGARKIKVTQATWSDYVFDSSYQLKPLEQVEAFIQENKHLPEVPSAVEVKNDGLDVGDNQAVLLKKIEELTLYIIQQNKDIQAQNKVIAGMKTEIAELKAERKP